MKKRIISALFCFILVISSTPVRASSENLVSDTDSLSYEETATIEQFIKTKVDFSDSSEFFVPVFNCDSKSLPTEDITLKLVGMSSYLDLSQMSSDFDFTRIDYESSNADVAIGFDNRILAVGVGTATLTLNYENMQYAVNVTVEEDIPNQVASLMSKYNNEGNKATRSISTSERDNIIQRARDMVYVRWVPTQNLRGWKGKTTFTKGTLYFGIPYSQTGNQVDANGFTSALSYSDFYDNYSISGTAMPKYGNDCSGFVSFAWGISRKTTVYFNGLPSIGSFSNLQRGDAVVYRINGSGHTFIILQNWITPPSGSSYTESYVSAYEQTPNIAQLTFHTYRQMSNAGYKPITKP